MEPAIRIISQQERLPLGDSTRCVLLYSLKERGEPSDIVIYCSDGQNAGAFAHQFFNAFGANCFWFVGADCSPEHRNAECVIGRDDFSFGMHESFFVNTVVDWATKVIGIRHSRNRSAVFGYSCGGALAASIGIRHPDVYGTIFALSIAYPIALAIRALELEPKKFEEPSLGILAWPFLAFSQMIWFVRLNATRRFFSSTSNLLGTMTVVSAVLTVPTAGLILLGLCVTLDLGVDPIDRLGASELRCVVQSLGGIASVIVALT